MNSIATALERAARTAKNRMQLIQNFETEFAREQFAPESESVVIGVPMSAALDWSHGRLSDLDLILSMNGDNSAIWWPVLPRISGYVAGIHACRKLRYAGAKMMVTFTSNPVVRGKCLKHGGRVTFRQESGERILVDDAALRDWLKF